MKEPYFTIVYLSLLAMAGICISIYKNRRHPHLIKKLAAGHLMINVPALLLIFGIPAAFYFLSEDLLWRIALMIMGGGAGLALAWIHWSLLIPKWRIWAFEGLTEEDLIKLEWLAVDQRLLWRQGHIFEKTEFRSSNDQETILKTTWHIEFLKEVERIKVDLGLGEKTIYPIRRKQLYLELISKAFLLSVVVGSFITGQIVMGIMLLCAVLLVGDNLNLLHNLSNKGSYIKINQTGILIRQRTSQFYNWGALYSISLERDPSALILEMAESRQKIEIKLDEFQIEDYKKLFTEMGTYLDRYIQRREQLTGGLN